MAFRLGGGCSIRLSYEGRVIGGAEEDRTPDLRIANATLSQLSYGPMNGKASIQGRIPDPVEGASPPEQEPPGNPVPTSGGCRCRGFRCRMQACIRKPIIPALVGAIKGKLALRPPERYRSARRSFRGRVPEGTAML